MVIVDIGQLALGFAIVFAAYVAGQRLKGWFQYKAKLDALHWMTRDTKDNNATAKIHVASLMLWLSEWQGE